MPRRMFDVGMSRIVVDRPTINKMPVAGNDFVADGF